MELNENADIDTSQVEDRRGSGGGGGGGLGGLPIPIGGGGLVGIIITVVLALVGGYFGVSNLGGGGGGEPSTGNNAAIEQKCSEQASKLDQLDCRNVLYVNSIQAYWREAAPESFGKQYEPAKTVFFENRVSTACGAADSGVGPFYCPGDNLVYIDLSFYEVLAKQLGAPGEFAQPYVLAHEYGHHIQDVIGTEAKMRRQQQGASEAEQNELSVRLELQADCYAGAWAKAASSTTTAKGQKIFNSLSEQDIQEGIQTAGQIGDDTLQQRGGGTINPAEFTHGTSAQRQKWFRTGFDSGDPKQCDTFSASSL